MPILTSIKDYAKKHRRGLIVTAAIGGGSYVLGRFATGKLRDLQEKSAADRMAKENLRRRFQQNQNDCVFTVLSMLPTIGEQILNELNIETSWSKLQESRKWEKKEEQRLKQGSESETGTTLTTETHNKESNNDGQLVDPENGDGTGVSTVEKASQDQAPQENDNAEPGQSSENDLGDSSTTPNAQDAAPTTVVSDKILDKKTKYLLWEGIKTTSFTRSLTAIYSVALLTLLTHIQLNLLGRFTYVWSVSLLNRSEPTIRLQHGDDVPEGGFVDPKTERMYLSATWWITHRGWRLCLDRVKEAVDGIVGSVPLKRVIGYADAEILVKKLRQAIEFEQDGTRTSFRKWMMPDTPEEEAEFLRESGFNELSATDDNGRTSLRSLLDETKDYIDSPDFAAVVSACLDEGFAIFDQNAFGKVLLPGAGSLATGGQRNRQVASNETAVPKKITLANLLPSISRQAHLVIAGNEYLNAFAYCKELQAFSAMIYTQYGEELKRT